jgi:hypothetical protein
MHGTSKVQLEKDRGNQRDEGYRSFSKNLYQSARTQVRGRGTVAMHIKIKFPARLKTRVFRHLVHRIAR